MGNLIKDFWTLKNERYSYGIVEVIKGEDLGQNRGNKRYETHIEKAFDYTLKHDVVSHMSIQTYSSWLNLSGKIAHEAWEKKYYPFTVEFEPNKSQKQSYEDAVLEATVYINYLVASLNVNKDDILIMINNNRSIYVMVNPKAFNCRPDGQLNEIYYKMYLDIKDAVGFKNVDESIIKSSFKVMKTPNSTYKNGYFVSIDIDELMKLLVGVVTKEELTSKKRPLNREVPAQLSMGLIKLYSKALKKVKNPNYTYAEDPEDFTPGCGKCIKYFMQHLVEEGHRNFAIVSVGIYLKSIGYTKDEVKSNLQDLADSWNYKEKIGTKVNTIFRKDYRFSCSYAQSVYSDLGIENMCVDCPRNIANRKMTKLSTVAIDPQIIKELWANKASTRHYVLYLKLAAQGLINAAFNIKDTDINTRTLKELCCLGGLKLKRENENVFIEAEKVKRKYYIPKAFIERSMDTLGDYLKHYLKLYIKGYKASDKYIMLKMNFETIMNELDYTSESSVYKFISKLKDLGLIKTKNLTDFCLYYESYKVINLRSADENHESNIQAKEIEENSILEAVGGYQIILKQIDGLQQVYFNEHPGAGGSVRKKMQRGSPHT